MEANDFLDYMLSGGNCPPEGSIVFDSSDHVRFQNGQNVSGHNCGCHRRIVIEKNIEGGEGYTVAMYNLDGIHPVWQNNMQMAPKRMRITNVIKKIFENEIEMRGFGYDAMGGSFADYGIVVTVDRGCVSRVQLNMFDRNVGILYLK